MDIQRKERIKRRGKWKKLNIHPSIYLFVSRPYFFSSFPNLSTSFFIFSRNLDRLTAKINENVEAKEFSYFDMKSGKVWSNVNMWALLCLGVGGSIRISPTWFVRRNQNNSNIVIFIAARINFQIKFQRMKNIFPNFPSENPPSSRNASPVNLESHARFIF